MPGYGITRGNGGYSSSNYGYNPLRGNNTNSQPNSLYSSLHYRSNQSNFYANNNTDNPYSNTTNSSHNTSLNHLSLHSVSNNGHTHTQNTTNPTHPMQYNPYAVLNQPTNTTLPDLFHPNTANKTHTPNKQSNESNTKQSAQGWNFNWIKSVWSNINIFSTPSKSQKTKSMTNPLPQTCPPNPYRPQPPQTQAPNNTNTNANIPVTPPQQTRPPMADIIYSQRTDQTHSTHTHDEKEHKTDHKTSKKEEGSAVINIHNLLQKTKLSPDDAAWLHSKIDAVTHDKYDGSLSYIGPIRTASQPLIQQLIFDDSATETTTQSKRSIYSPLRHTTHTQAKKSVIPSSIPCTRYQPHPGGFHKTQRAGSVSVRSNRKRVRRDVFEEDMSEHRSVDMYESYSGPMRKKMRMSGKRGSVKRKPFRNSYLRPINAVQTSQRTVGKYEDLRTVASKAKRKSMSLELNTNNLERGKDDKNGFCFARESVNRVETIMNGNIKAKVELDSDDLSENIVMKENGANGKGRKHKKRSPLRDKKIFGNNKVRKKEKSENEEMTKEDSLDKMKEDKTDVNERVTPKKTPKRKRKKTPTHSTPISRAFAMANDAILNSPKRVNGNTDNTPPKKEESPKKTPPKIIAASPSPKLTNITPKSPKMNEDKKEIKEKQSEKVKKSSEETETETKTVKKESYLTTVMRERKERYIKCYTMRFTRIYTEYQSSKLEKVSGFIDKYGWDCDKLHNLYHKVCGKYKLESLPKYDGQLDLNEAEKERKKAKTPEKTETTQTFKFATNGTKDKSKTGTNNEWSFGGSTDQNQTKEVSMFGTNGDKTHKVKESPKTPDWSFGGFGTGDKAKKTAQKIAPKIVSETVSNPFQTAKSPFGNGNGAKDAKVKSKDVTAENSNSNQGWGPNPFGTANNDKPKPAMNGEGNGDFGNGPKQFVLPSEISFTDPNGTANVKKATETNTNNGSNSNSFSWGNDSKKDKKATETNMNGSNSFSWGNDKKDKKASETQAPNTNGWNQNNGFQFGTGSNDNNAPLKKPSLNTASTELVTPKVNGTNDWSFGNGNNSANNGTNSWGNTANDTNKSSNDTSMNWDTNGKSKSQSTFSFGNGNANTGESKTETNNEWSFGGSTDQNQTNNTKPNKTNNSSGFSWDNNQNNKSTANMFGSPSKNNNGSVFGKNNNGNNGSAFGNNNNSFGSNNNNTSFGNPNTNANGSNNNSNGFSMNNTNPNGNSGNNGFGNNSNGNPFGTSNNGNNTNPNGNGFSNGFGNNNNGNNGNGNGNFSFQSTNGASNQNNNGNNSSFFKTSNGRKKRPVYKAKRRK